MQVVSRTKPRDAALAQRNFEAVHSFFKDHGRRDVEFRKTQSHGFISKADRAAFQQRYPNLPVPESVVFRRQGTSPMGVTYSTTNQQFDLGLGTQHAHSGHEERMQHIWFTPGDMELAFSDVEHGMAPGMSKVMERNGYAT